MGLKCPGKGFDYLADGKIVPNAILGGTGGPILAKQKFYVWIAGNEPEHVKVCQPINDLGRIGDMTFRTVPDDKADCRTGTAWVKKGFAKVQAFTVILVVYFNCPPIAPTPGCRRELFAVISLHDRICVRPHDIREATPEQVATHLTTSKVRAVTGSERVSG